MGQDAGTLHEAERGAPDRLEPDPAPLGGWGHGQRGQRHRARAAPSNRAAPVPDAPDRLPGGGAAQGTDEPAGIAA